MKRFFGICLAAALAAGSAQAANWKVSVFGGYGTAAGGALNDMISGMETLGYETTEISSAIPIGVEVMRLMNENLSVGVRAGYVMANEASTKMTIAGLIMGLPFEITGENTWSASALPVLAGIRYSMPAGDKLSVNAGLFAGISSIGLSTDITTRTTFLGSTTEVTASGSDSALGLGGAILVGGTMKMGEKTELGLDVGYQINSVDMEYLDPVTSMPVEDTLDLSGLLVTLSIGMLF